MAITRSITSLELIHYYESLVKEKRNEYATTNRFSKAFKQKKKIFKRLIDLLDDQNIPPKEFILIQFKMKGYRPYPAQLLSKEAFQRWKSWNNTRDIKGLHEIQEGYLKKLKSIGYTVEEALTLDIFFYYFRRIHLKEVSRACNMFADREVERMPGLKEFLEEKF